MTGIIRFIQKTLLEGYTIQRYTKNSLLSVKSHFWITKMIPFHLESCHTVKSMGKKFCHLVVQAKIMKLLGKISCCKIKTPLACLVSKIQSFITLPSKNCITGINLLHFCLLINMSQNQYYNTYLLADVRKIHDHRIQYHHDLNIK